MRVNLTFADYADLGYSSVEAGDFTVLARQAQRAVDSVTDYYYQDHVLVDDPDHQRVDAYKAAICEQVDFIQSTGVASSYENGNDFNAITVGRLSLQPANHVTKDSMVGGVCKEAYRLLAHYGLLYRGRGSDLYVATHPQKDV